MSFTWHLLDGKVCPVGVVAGSTGSGDDETPWIFYKRDGITSRFALLHCSTIYTMPSCTAYACHTLRDFVLFRTLY